MSNGNTDFFIQETKEKLSIQFEEAKSLVTKASALVGFIAVIISIILTVETNITLNYSGIFRSGLILLFVSLLLAFIGFIPFFKLRRDPDPRFFASRYYNQPILKSKEWLLRRLIHSYEDNIDMLLSEHYILWASVIFLLIALVLLAISVFGS